MKVQYTMWFGKNSDFSNVPKLGQHEHATTNGPETVKNKKLLHHAVPEYFVRMQSHCNIYRIYIPTERSVIITRAQDVKFTSEQLSSINNLIEFSSLQRSKVEIAGQEGVKEHLDAGLAFSMVSHSRFKYLMDDCSVL